MPLENTLADVVDRQGSRCCRTCASCGSSVRRGHRRVRLAVPPRIFSAGRPAPPTKRRARADRHAARTQAFRGPVSGDDLQGLHDLLRRRPSARRFRDRHPARAAGDPGEPAIRVPLRRSAARRFAPGQSYRLSEADLASRLSYFLWGTMPDAELLKVVSEPHAASPGRARQAGQAHAREPARRRRCRRASRRSGCACRISTRSHPDYLQYPQYDDRLAQALQARDRAVLRQPGARGSQPARPADGRLHVRQRACGRCTTASRTSPALHSASVTLPPERRGILGHGSILVLTSNSDRTSPGLSRQVGDGSAARQPAAAAAAQRADARRSEVDRRRPHAVGARAHGGAPQEPDVQLLPSRDRPARPRARKLRSDRCLAHQGQRGDGGSGRHALRRHQDRRSRPACAPRCSSTRTPWS